MIEEKKEKKIILIKNRTDIMLVLFLLCNYCLKTMKIRMKIGKKSKK